MLIGMRWIALILSLLAPNLAGAAAINFQCVMNSYYFTDAKEEPEYRTKSVYTPFEKNPIMMTLEPLKLITNDPPVTSVYEKASFDDETFQAITDYGNLLIWKFNRYACLKKPKFPASWTAIYSDWVNISYFDCECP